MSRRHAISPLALPLATPWAEHAQATEVQFLPPSVRFLVAFAPHKLAAARGYHVAEGVKSDFLTIGACGC